jgi:glycosyltransferase involved in cell wall biosynthesis
MIAVAERAEASKAPERLLVLVSDTLSSILEKGEVVERYYNPGELFPEVHIVLTNVDRPDSEQVQPMVGDAGLHIHNLPTPGRFAVRTLGWQPRLLRPWIEQGLDLVRRIDPSLVRSYNNFVEGYLASCVKRELGTPYVVSLHGVWDRDDLRSPSKRIAALFRRRLERTALRDADAVIAVYEPILRYARKLGGPAPELVYNAVAGDKIPRKRSYAVGERARLITVNRQVPEKSPEKIIRAVADLDCEYTVVGDGILHDSLVQLARDLHVDDRVRFVKTVPNDELCRQLREYDLMVSHCDFWGMSKTLIEAALAGLPAVINRHPETTIVEYAGGWIEQCESSSEGYRAAIERLLQDDAARKKLGEAAYSTAIARFEPSSMEARVRSIYERALAESKSPR